MSVTKFQLGRPASNSTPATPVMGGPSMTFTINPNTWEETLSGGSMKQVISGNPRLSTTQIPKRMFTINWMKLSELEKQALDGYISLCTTLVLKDDTGTYYEVVTVPGSYRSGRRRSIKDELVSWTASVQFMILGS